MYDMTHENAMNSATGVLQQKSKAATGVLQQKLSLKSLQYSRKNTCVGVSF